MRKLIATLAVIGLSSVAFAQDVSVNGEHKSNARGHMNARNHEASESQAGAKSVDLQDRPDVNVKSNPRIQSNTEMRNREDVNLRGRDRYQDRDQERSRTDVNINAQPRTETRTETTRHEERAENRGGKFFFRDREIHRHPGFDHNDYHFRIGRHDRNWYYTHYSNVIFIDGCWYYEDGGFFWPAYGFDPSCDYPDPFITFQF